MRDFSTLKIYNNFNSNEKIVFEEWYNNVVVAKIKLHPSNELLEGMWIMHQYMWNLPEQYINDMAERNSLNYCGYYGITTSSFKEGFYSALKEL